MEHRIEHTAKKRAKRRAAAADGFPSLFLNCAIGAGASLLLSLLLIPLGGAICFAADDPASLTAAAGLTIRFLSALAGGAVAVRRNRGQVLLSGGLCGLLLFFLFALLSLIFSPEIRPFSVAIARLLRLAVIPVSMIGAMLGSKKKRTVRRKRR